MRKIALLYSWIRPRIVYFDRAYCYETKHFSRVRFATRHADALESGQYQRISTNTDKVRSNYHEIHSS